jgi:hypothetical protein
MPFIGNQPASVPLTSSDITDGIISLPKLTDGTDGNLISYDASGNPVAVATGTDGQVLTSTGAGSPPVSETLPTGGTNTPAFDIRRNSYQTISSATSTKVALDAASLDTDSGFDADNNRWTVPSEKGGTYYIAYSIFLDSGADANYQYGWGQLYLNGAALTTSIADSRSNNSRQWSVSGEVVLALSVGDYLELFGTIADSSGSPQFGGGASGGEKNKTHLSGYKLIT